MHGRIFNIQRYSVRDGPGIRTTVFLKGCPMACAWCHNPEGRSPEPELVIVESRCVRCGQCWQVCPQPAPPFAPGPRPVPEDQCTLCGACIEACPTQSRQIAGRTVSAAEIMEEILRDRIFYDDSGGGVTLSGGEPLLQPEFVMELLRACRLEGIHTTVDTCGFAPWDTLAAAAALTDLFLYDVKMMDDTKHRLHTGVSNRIILDNLRRLCQIHRQIWIRVPVIPGVNDSLEDWDALATFLLELPDLPQVDLLPYHRLGIPKYTRVRDAYLLSDTPVPTPESLEGALRRLTERGLPARIDHALASSAGSGDRLSSSL